MSTAHSIDDRHFIKRFRFWGIRALNWAPKLDPLMTQIDHAEASGCAPWLAPGPINIIIGPNGGGKTTVIDLIRALEGPDLWPSLPRENRLGEHFSGFQFEGGDWAIRAEFVRSGFSTPDAEFRERLFNIVTSKVDVQSLSEKAWMPLFPNTDDENQPEPSLWKTRIEKSLQAASSPKIAYCEPAGNNPERDIPNLPEILNEIWPFLHSVNQIEIPGTGVAEPPFSRFGDKSTTRRVGVVLDEDRGQPSFLDPEILPLGWRQFAYVISFMRSAPERSIALLDEPDRVLHPRLQRVLLQAISEIAKERHQQVFIATHSPALINPSLIEPLGAVVFRANGNRCTALADRRDVLDDLGVCSADLAQANGVIWVEGPTDRIYINRWLQLYAEHTDHPPWVEGIDYQIACYGGALLKYLTLEDSIGRKADKVSMRSINRNFFVVMDLDLDKIDDDGVASSSTKKRLLNEARRQCTDAPVWITQHYTMENYLPKRFDKWLKETATGRTQIVGRKITLADRFRTADLKWEDSFSPQTNLPEKITSLFECIGAWQAVGQVEMPGRPVAA